MRMVTPRRMIAALGLCAVLTGCSVGGAPRFDVFNLVGSRCVDGRGPNSTPEQIVDAQLALEITDPATGEKKTMAEMGEEMYKKMAQLLPGLPAPPPGQFRQKLLANVYTFVPQGGDAAFSRAICGMQSSWERIGLGSQTDAAKVASTPHVLRGAGRAICQAVSGSFAEDALENEGKQVEQAKADPEKFKKSMLADLDKTIEAIDTSNTPAGNPFATSAAEMHKTRDKLARTPGATIARNLGMAHEIKWLAVRHQCPTLSRYGFGPDCGEFVLPSGKRGILRVKDSTRSCSDAKRIVENYYAHKSGGGRYRTLEPSSPLTSYSCAEGGYQENDDFPLIVECAPAGDGRYRGGWVIVKPA